MFSCIQKVDKLRLYTESGVSWFKFACIDVYDDETTLSQSGAHNAFIVRMQLENGKGQIDGWRDVGIAPVLMALTRKSNAKLSKEILIVHHRFLHLLLRDSILASKIGFIVQSRLIFLKIGKLIFEQNQNARS